MYSSICASLVSLATLLALISSLARRTLCASLVIWEICTSHDFTDASSSFLVWESSVVFTATSVS
ncbi:hypothetical protein [Aeromonas phage Akh-2]|nr:hypothetical protein [Aeromonas phage Akh-2]